MTEKQKLLAPPRVIQRRSPSRPMKVVIRATIALTLFILGFNFSNSAFFRDYPLFGLNYLAEILISLLAGALGYFIIPDFIANTSYAVEALIRKTVAEIVTDFWEMQSRKIQEQRRVKQKVKAEKEKKKSDEEIHNALVIDTSVLIDGRILDVVKQGFMDNPLIVLQAVISELHILSDGKDTLKRQRGRRGLDIVKELKKKTKVIIIDEKTILPKEKIKEVDQILVEFSKVKQLKLLTLDFNLNKVASVSGVKVLNINSLANSLKIVMLPGEEVTVKIVQAGREKQQGIGYLQDGTMLVVEDAKDKLGQELKVTVSKVIQSPAGKMIFCK